MTVGLMSRVIGHGHWVRPVSGTCGGVQCVLALDVAIWAKTVSKVGCQWRQAIFGVTKISFAWCKFLLFAIFYALSSFARMPAILFSLFNTTLAAVSQLLSRFVPGACVLASKVAQAKGQVVLVLWFNIDLLVDINLIRDGQCRKIGQCDQKNVATHGVM